jgi:rare lipoprotein A
LALTSCASSVRFSSAGGIDYRLLGSTSGGSTPAASRTSSTTVAKSQQPALQPLSGSLRTDTPLLTARPDASLLEPTDMTFYGIASYYGDEFHGRKTASGEVFNQNEFTAAHRTLPFGTIVKVTYPETEKSVIVRINDRGPFKADRVIDLSRSAANELGLVRSGTGAVEVVVMQQREPSAQ